MSLFSDIPVRSNADTDLVDASWWNIIRTKLISAFGAVDSYSPVTIADNQTTYADITNLVGNASYSRMDFEYTIYRTDGSSDHRRETGLITLSQNQGDSTWDFTRSTRHGDALNIADSMTHDSASGQVSYKSDSMGGTYTGKITFKLVQTFDLES